MAAHFDRLLLEALLLIASDHSLILKADGTYCAVSEVLFVFSDV